MSAFYVEVCSLPPSPGESAIGVEVEAADIRGAMDAARYAKACRVVVYDADGKELAASSLPARLEAIAIERPTSLLDTRVPQPGHEAANGVPDLLVAAAAVLYSARNTVSDADVAVIDAAILRLYGPYIA